MVTVIVPITDQRVSSDNLLVASSIVGAAPWDDEDDATYTNATLSVRDEGTQSDEHYGDLAAIDLTGATAWSATLEVTLTNSGGASGLRGSAEFYEQGWDPNTDSPKFTLADSGVFYYVTTTSGVKAVKTFTTVYEDLDVAGMVAALATPTTVMLSRYTVGFAPPSDYTSRIHRLVLSFEVPVAVVAGHLLRRRQDFLARS